MNLTEKEKELIEYIRRLAEREAPQGVNTKLIVKVKSTLIFFSEEQSERVVVSQ